MAAGLSKYEATGSEPGDRCAARWNAHLRFALTTGLRFSAHSNELDVFDPAGQQIHDFNPGITESGLFWTIPISENTISVNFGAGTAAFQASNVDFEDYHDVVNALLDGPEVDAAVSWDIRWSHPMGRTKIRDVQNGFAGDFVQNVAQIAWAGQTDTATFVSDAASTSVNEFSLLAHERNGVFFS